MPCPHTHAIRVYYEDTDAGGIVYHASYLRFAERARTEYLRELKWNHERIKQELDALLIVRHIEIDYRAPAMLDDTLAVHTEACEIGNTSLTLAQTILRNEQTLAEMKVVIVAVSPDKRAIRFPPQLRQIFAKPESVL